MMKQESIYEEADFVFADVDDDRREPGHGGVQGGSLVRVSSENMPDDGLEAFDAVWEVMEKARLNAVPLP